MGCSGSKNAPKEGKKKDVKAATSQEAAAKKSANNTTTTNDATHKDTKAQTGGEKSNDGAKEPAADTAAEEEAKVVTKEDNADNNAAAAAFTSAVADIDGREGRDATHSSTPVAGAREEDEGIAEKEKEHEDSVEKKKEGDEDSVEIEEVEEDEGSTEKEKEESEGNTEKKMEGDEDSVEEKKEGDEGNTERKEEAHEVPATTAAAAAAVGDDVDPETAAAEEPAALSTATAPDTEKESSHFAGTLRKESVSANQQDAQVAQGKEGYLGPGPAADFVIEKVYGCFDEGNGLLFRLVSNRRRMWAFYNDTTEYVMQVSVVFGNESMVRPLGQATQTMMNAVTGQCQIDVVVRPGETQPFMRGEYNGFATRYEAIPFYVEEGANTEEEAQTGR